MGVKHSSLLPFPEKFAEELMQRDSVPRREFEKFRQGSAELAATIKAIATDIMKPVSRVITEINKEEASYQRDIMQVKFNSDELLAFIEKVMFNVVAHRTAYRANQAAQFERTFYLLVFSKHCNLVMVETDAEARGIKVMQIEPHKGTSPLRETSFNAWLQMLTKTFQEYAASEITFEIMPFYMTTGLQQSDSGEVCVLASLFLFYYILNNNRDRSKSFDVVKFQKEFVRDIRRRDDELGRVNLLLAFAFWMFKRRFSINPSDFVLSSPDVSCDGKAPCKLPCEQWPNTDECFLPPPSRRRYVNTEMMAAVGEDGASKKRKADDSADTFMVGGSSIKSSKGHAKRSSGHAKRSSGHAKRSSGHAKRSSGHRRRRIEMLALEGSAKKRKVVQT